MPVVDEILDAKIPIKLWTPLKDVEEGAKKQLRNVANHPRAIFHVAVMPDVHQGFGATIGTVMATKSAVAPFAVGVDIGCGMMAVKTSLKAADVMNEREEILGSLKRSIPTNFHGNEELSKQVEMWLGWDDLDAVISFLPEDKKASVLYKAKYQMGTLGSGNHFLEICLDEEENVWVMLHSGSRHVGKQIADHWVRVAKEETKDRLPDFDLAFIESNSSSFPTFWHGLSWAQAYAYQNRVEMMRKVIKDLTHLLGGMQGFGRLFEINCHHNYASVETHFGEEVYITRKGAIKAGKGDYGIIPGSMGAKSFIVEGKGEPDSFNSCSHGAGRKFGRKEAKRRFTIEDFRKQMGSIVSNAGADCIDEIPSAYKNIETVIAQQSDLAKPIATLRQIVCMKGGKE